MMSHRGGDGSTVQYSHDFFGWLECQIAMIEDFSYEGMDSIGDPNIPLVVGM